jgi:hypothetical protein
VCDTVGYYAAQLAAPRHTRLRVDFRVHDNATNAELLDVLDAAAATLAHVARAAPSDARGYHSAGIADVTGFLAMGCNEILVHGCDACLGLGFGLLVPPDLAARVCQRLFPWAPGDGAPWPALLWANGRVELPGHRRVGPDWVWHCAPLDEWDGTTPTWRDPSPAPVMPGAAAGHGADGSTPG